MTLSSVHPFVYVAPISYLFIYLQPKEYNYFVPAAFTNWLHWFWMGVTFLFTTTTVIIYKFTCSSFIHRMTTMIHRKPMQQVSRYQKNILFKFPLLWTQHSAATVCWFNSWFIARKCSSSQWLLSGCLIENKKCKKSIKSFTYVWRKTTLSNRNPFRCCCVWTVSATNWLRRNSRIVRRDHHLHWYWELPILRLLHCCPTIGSGSFSSAIPWHSTFQFYSFTFYLLFN